MKRVRDLMSLDGRVAIVTGGAGHIGAAFCEAMAEFGATIVVLDISRDKCDPVAATIANEFGVKTMPLVADLSDENQVLNVPEQVLNRFGRIDIFVNCAAYIDTSKLEGWLTPFQEQSSQTWRHALEVNLTSAFVLTQACMQSLKESGKGSIINVGILYGCSWSRYATV